MHAQCKSAMQSPVSFNPSNRQHAYTQFKHFKPTTKDPKITDSCQNSQTQCSSRCRPLWHPSPRSSECYTMKRTGRSRTSPITGFESPTTEDQHRHHAPVDEHPGRLYITTAVVYVPWQVLSLDPPPSAYQIHQQAPRLYPRTPSTTPQPF